MAFVVLRKSDDTVETKTLSPEQGIAIWRVLNGEVEPASEAQEEFCLKVKRIYLNRESAPQSYLDRFPLPETEAANHREWKEPWFQKL